MNSLKKFINRGILIIYSKRVSITIGIIAVIAVLLIGFVSPSGEKFKPDNVGRQVRIRWEEVNLRTGYSTSNEIITTLFKGSSVTLTGNYYEYFIENGISIDSWTEVELKDGTIGWVVTTSIKWT